MADQAKLRRQKNRGQHAKRLLEDELFKEAFATIEAQILEAWKNSAGGDTEVRQNAYLMQRLLQNLKEQFAACVRTGNAATAELLRIEKEAKT